MKSLGERPKILKRYKGSILLMVILFTTAASILIGSLLRWGTTESRMTERHFTRLKAQNGAESLVTSGLAQLALRWKQAVTFPLDELSPSNQPLIIPASFANFFNGTPVILADAELIGASVGPGAWVYIDPNDPGNFNDPLKGKLVFSRNVDIISKVSAKVPITSDVSDKINAFAQEILQIRDSPLFGHAIFYNMDLEFHPGPLMDISGPVHTNGNLYASAIDNLYFHDIVTTAGDYFHRLAPGHPESPQTGNVWFRNSAGTFITDYKGTGDKTLESSYYDSLYPNWSAFANQTWNGFLQTQEHGAPKLNPIGYQDYVRDDPTTAAIDDDLNYAYAIIEPNQNYNNGTNPLYKGTIGEREKYAQKAGLTIRVHDTDPTPNNSDRNKTKFKLSNNYWITFHKIDRTNGNQAGSVPIFDGNGNISESALKVDRTFVNNILSMDEYKENGSGKPTSGFWDSRRNMGINTLDINIGEFKKGVDNTDPSYDSSVWTGTTSSESYSPEDLYNGIVYVEFPTDTSLPARPDNIIVSKQNLGLQVSNGSIIPSPTYIAPELVDTGFTLATNNALYVKGNFNADGNPNTGSSTQPDNASNPEPPASLAADSLTVLSNNWDPTKSKLSKNSRPAVFNEINAALLQGNYVTNKAGSGIGSGGLHNFPRFLENWSGVTLRYRGSMVSLFESEVGYQGYNTSYYNPPRRDWGFYEELIKGAYPPGMPNARSFRGLDFRFLTETEYEAKKADILSSF